MSASLSLRRLRQSRLTRELARGTRVLPEQLVQPLFVVEGLRDREPVPGLTGVYRDTEKTLLTQIENDLERGVSKFLLFGVQASKRREAFDYGFAARQIAEVRRQFGDSVFLSVDVCLCSSTEHGQCGVLNADGSRVLNRETVDELVRAAVTYAQAGADCVAPSDMMDGRIGAIRAALDAGGLEQTLLMSYAAKFHSRFYGPFRAAADSAPKGLESGVSQLQDRATYQIDPGNARDALASARRDAAEGADILMVKPGLPYLDILQTLSREIADRPWAVYEVSGEYAAIELMAGEGLLGAGGAGPAHVEAWTSLVRAGAQIVITYGARNGREWLGRK